MKTRKVPQQLVSEVQLFRIRVAAAESKLKMMREQAREAKRRRKEAKRNAQLVRRRYKQSKADLSELRETLAKAEAKLFQAGGRALARKAARAKRMTQSPTRVGKTAKAAPRRRRAPATSGTNRKPARTAIKPKEVKTRLRNPDRHSGGGPVTTAETGTPDTLPTRHAESPATANATNETL